MREQHIPTRVCAQVLGVSPSTVRRLKQARALRRACERAEDSRTTRPRPLDRPCDPWPGRRRWPVACDRSAAAALCGNQAARGARDGARKACTLRERRARGAERDARIRCDALEAIERKAYWLVAADAALPYRTSIATVTSYDTASVVEALRVDFEVHGAPLVLRLDRIACQRTPEVDALLDSYLVLALHGPPRHPYYYGQLERQNRDHRAWYRLLPPVTLRELAAAGCDMRTSLNALWPRPTLDGCTAEQAWQRRRPVDVDRHELRHEVERCTTHLLAGGAKSLTARRIAIESALMNRGLLTINQGGWC
jgi:hypothetical protein